MRAGETKLVDLIGINKSTLTIPVYQRNYDWKQDNCEQLFYDIEKIVTTKTPHFLGTIVYQKPVTIGAYQEFIIIDGQQRITSAILFIKALYDSTDDEELREDIRLSYLKNTRGKCEYRLKLKPIEYDRSIFEKLIDCDDFDEKLFSTEEKTTNIYRNYDLFKELIFDSQESVRDLYEIALPSLWIVQIVLDNENPQAIFESLNSTGLDLSNTDLIRNYLLMPLEYKRQEDLYKKFWMPLEKRIHPENMERFILQYLITKKRTDSVTYKNKKAKLTTKNLYDSFKQFIQIKEGDEDAVEQCLVDLQRYSIFFQHFLFTDNTNVSLLSDLDKKFYELVYLLDSSNSPIVLMYLYDKYDSEIITKESFRQCVDALISLSFRSKVCKNTGVSSQFAGNLISRLDQEHFCENNSSIFWDAITAGRGSYAFPGDGEFKQALKTTELYTSIKSDGCKYLLYKLETCSGHSKELPDYSVGSVEHIMPKTLSEKWKEYLNRKKDTQAYDQLLNTIGNLTLSNYNSEWSNSDFPTKKIEYAKSSYYYTKDLVNYSDWTSAQIQMRAEQLASSAILIWALPEKYNCKVPAMEIIYNLDSDVGLFTGTKLDIVSIFDEEKKSLPWYMLAVEIARKLYELDKEAFRQAISMDNIPAAKRAFSSKPDAIQGAVKIDEDLYMGTKYSTEYSFKLAKTMVENFGLISKASFKDDVWFTIK